MLDENIFPALIHIMATAEFKTRKEAAWAITNATSGGTQEQIQHLVEQVCILKFLFITKYCFLLLTVHPLLFRNVSLRCVIF